MADTVVDVAIVGGGVSGVYSGWRLATSGEVASVAVFESSERIGGRLLSVKPPGMPNTVCELGGMRYITTQTLIKALVEDVLQLQHEPFTVSAPENIAYLRGHRLRTADLADPAKIPYELTWWERNQDLGSLMVAALDQIVPGAAEKTAEELGQIEVDGRYLWQWGFWNLLRRVLSNEAYEFLQDSSGYMAPTANWNAADAIPGNVGDFGGDIEYRRISGGFQVVPRTLADRFEEAGGAIHLGHRLRRFDAEALDDGSTGVRLHFDPDVTVLARRLVLAMPRRSLELIEQTGAFFEDPMVQRLIKTVNPVPFFKAFVCYPYPWWQWANAADGSAGLSAGESVTDLPLRQCYYWEVDAENDNAVLLATYDDSRMTEFWAGLESEEKYEENFEGLGIDHDTGGSEREQWRTHAAPQAMVEEIHRQLLDLHGTSYAPDPYSAAYMDWRGGLFGGAVNFWNIGAKSWEVIERMTQPKPELPVHVCGSAYSSSQGWVEGALTVAEQMLEKHFGLGWPSWAPDEGPG